MEPTFISCYIKNWVTSIFILFFSNQQNEMLDFKKIYISKPFKK